MRTADLGAAPTPEGVASRDELASRLSSLRTWAGLSYRELHRRVVASRRQRGIPELPVFETVRRCLQPGRRRLDPELVVDIATALTGDAAAAAAWRQACRVVDGTQTVAALVPVRDDLPAAPVDLHGRDAVLGAILRHAAEREGAAVIAIEGMGGVGKSSLAARAARELARGLPDAVLLSVDLRAYDDLLPPADPTAVLDGFLRTLGVPGSRIIRMDLAARAAAFRELLAGRCAVVLLDNAATRDQVLPLLPGGAGSRVLVTSRHHLGLDASLQVPLEVLDEESAVALLAHEIGDERPEREPGAARRIAELLGRLPLALSVVAARIRETPAWTLGDHAERLEEARSAHRLEGGVQAALDLSYAALPAGHRRTLSLLALQPGNDVDAHAVAALTGQDLTVTQTVLGDLRARHLLLERTPGRYLLHDLVRTFASGKAMDEIPPSGRRVAVMGLLEHQVYVATLAARVHSPEIAGWLEARDPAGSPVPAPADAADAARRLAADWPNMLAAAHYAAEHDAPHVTVALALALFRYLQVTARAAEAEALLVRAASLAEGVTRARVLSALGTTYFPQGRFPAAEAPLVEAADLYRLFGDEGGLSAVLTNLGIVYEASGRLERARASYEEALERATRMGDAARALRARGSLGQLETALGRHDEALEHFRGAHDLAVELADPAREAQTLVDLGDALRRMDRFADALVCLERAHDLAAEVGLEVGEPYLLSTLGAVHSALGDHATAMDHHERALVAARRNHLAPAEIDVLLDLGDTLVRAGRTGDAVGRYDEAAGLAARLGLGAQRAAADERRAAATSGAHETPQAADRT